MTLESAFDFWWEQKFLFSSGPHSLLGGMIWVPPSSDCGEYRIRECGALQFDRDLPLFRRSPLPTYSEPLDFSANESGN